jgi:hypothetical protein
MFPFHTFFTEKPEYVDLVGQFFRENILFLSENCVSSRVAVADVLKAFKKKFNKKITREQLKIAMQFLKIRLEQDKDDDNLFVGIELLQYKPFKFTRKNEKCVKCGLYQDLNEKKQCIYCRVDLTLKKKRKEHQVRDFLLDKGWKFYSSDRVVDNDCGKERPDILFDFVNFFVCVEVDENQHRTYECEIPRMLNIYHAVGMRTMIFVRFNPDSFVDKYYKKNKTSLEIRCEYLHEFLQKIERDKEYPTLVEYRLFFDYDPLLVYTSPDCFSSEKVLVEREVLDLVTAFNKKS